ncbi:13250_t:CDS:1, partial [Racocetra fulgida]
YEDVYKDIHKDVYEAIYKDIYENIHKDVYKDVHKDIYKVDQLSNILARQKSIKNFIDESNAKKFRVNIIKHTKSADKKLNY